MVQPDTFLLQGSEEALDHPVVLRRGAGDELLSDRKTSPCSRASTASIARPWQATERPHIRGSPHRGQPRDWPSRPARARASSARWPRAGSAGPRSGTGRALLPSGAASPRETQRPTHPAERSALGLQPVDLFAHVGESGRRVSGPPCAPALAPGDPARVRPRPRRVLSAA
jgi:hypothetical protein